MMELMDAGSLLDNLKLAGDKAITRGALSHVAKRMLEALEHLHEECLVVHRDVKPVHPTPHTPPPQLYILHPTLSRRNPKPKTRRPAPETPNPEPYTLHQGNILLSHSGGIKLSDFGICARVDASGAPTTAGGLTQWVGTVTYMSPERIMGDDYSTKADVWSLGVVVAEAALGRYPYANEDGKRGPLEFWDLLHLVVNGVSPAETLAGSGGSADACAFVDACTDKDPDTRASAAAALAHPFVAGIDERAGRDALQTWVQSVWRGTAPPTPGQQHPTHTSEPAAKTRVHPVLERRKSAGDVVLDAPSPSPVAARQQRRALPGRGARSAPAALLSKEDAPAEKHRAAEKNVSSAPAEKQKKTEADKKVVAKMEAPKSSTPRKMEVPAILGEGSLDKPRGMSDLLTVLKSAILAN